MLGQNGVGTNQTMSKQEIFTFPLRVYYEDTDAGGIVYHATYLNFMERARTEWLLSKGVNLHRYAHDEKKMFVVRTITINYHQPAFLCDELRLTTEIHNQRKTRVVFWQKIFRQDDLLADALVELVCIHTDTRKPVVLPTFFSSPSATLSPTL